MDTITIAAIEKQAPKQADWAPTYKIKTSTGDLCFANVGNWNAAWAPGMAVQVVKEQKPGKKYFTLKCPEELKPKLTSPNVNSQSNGADQPVMEALRKVYGKLNEIEKKLDSLVLAQQRASGAPGADAVDIFFKDEEAFP